MRALFNTTADIFGGPGSLSPGILRGSCPCRFVRDDAFFAYGDGSPVFAGYVTLDAFAPIGAWLSPGFGMDPRLSDQIAIPSGSSVRYWVLFVEQAIWHVRTPYFRAYVVSLPLPPEFPPSSIALIRIPEIRERFALGEVLPAAGRLAFGEVLPAAGRLAFGEVLPAAGGIALCDPVPLMTLIELRSDLAAAGEVALASSVPAEAPLALGSVLGPSPSSSFICSAVLPAAGEVALSLRVPAAGSIGFS